MAHSSSEDPGSDGGGGRPAGSRWEWVAAILSIALVLGAIGYLVYDGLRYPESPPEVGVRVDSVVVQGEGFLVQFSAVNRGRQTAAEVRIEAEMESGGRVVERGEATIDYLPGESTRRGGIFFRRDPRGQALRLRAAGYQEP